MTLPAAEPIVCQAPRYLHSPKVSQSAASEAIDLAAAAGLVLDPWQQVVLEHSLGVRDNGKWASVQVGLVVPRQNGKGSILEARELAGLFLFGERLILHSAHEFKTSSEHFLRIRQLIEDNPDFERKVKIIRTGVGSEGIELRSGQRLRFVARSKGSGRGFTGDLIVLDEAYNLNSAMMSALVPTLSARPNPQLWYTSSAPLPIVESDSLRRICARGRACEGKQFTYLEWCADPLAGNDDYDALQEANPSLGIRLNEDIIDVEREDLEPADFRRERLGIWAEDDRIPVFGRGKWEACADPTAKRPDMVSLAFDVAPDRSSGAIGVSGWVGEMLSVDVAVHGDGMTWLVDEIVRLVRRYRPGRVVCDAVGPAHALLPALEKRKVTVDPVNVSQHQGACGALFDDVVEGHLIHPDVDSLNAAVVGAEKRDIGDGGWLWSRKHSSVDISPLVAVTLARWAAAQPPAKRVLTTASVH